MNIVRLINSSTNNSPIGAQDELLKAIMKERFLRQDMVNIGSPHIRKRTEGALSVKESFSRLTKDLVIEDKPHQKLLNAVDNILADERFGKQLKSLLEISNIKRLLQERKQDFQETMKRIGKPDIKFLLNQRIIPEETLKELTSLITTNQLEQKESMTLMYKEFIKHFNLEEYRNTFTRLMTEQIKKIK